MTAARFCVLWFSGSIVHAACLIVFTHARIRMYNPHFCKYSSMWQGIWSDVSVKHVSVLPAPSWKQACIHESCAPSSVSAEETISADSKLTSPSRKWNPNQSTSSWAPSLSRTSPEKIWSAQCSWFQTLPENTTPLFSINRRLERMMWWACELVGKQQALQLDLKDTWPLRPSCQHNLAENSFVHENFSTALMQLLTMTACFLVTLLYTEW